MKSRKEKLNELERQGKLSARILTDTELLGLKKIMFQAYMDVAKVCQTHKLTNMLCGGSCLGAVRHNGYIPWDDDFDAAMPRADFEILKKVFERELGDKYELNSPNYSKVPSNRFPKVLIKGTKFVEYGMNPTADYAKCKFDIFIIENIPRNKLIRAIKGLFCTGVMFIAGRVDNRFWYDLADRCLRYKKPTGVLGIPSGRKHYFGEIFDKSVFIPVSTGNFEGETVALPNNYDMYMRNLYGNYMELPPEEKREKHPIVEIQLP